MKPKIIGRYKFGRDTIEVYIRDGFGGDFNFYPDQIGIGKENTSELEAALMHELVEFYLTKNHCRYEDSANFSNCLSSFKFFLDHTQLGSMARAVAFVFPLIIKDIKKEIKYASKKL